MSHDPSFGHFDRPHFTQHQDDKGETTYHEKAEGLSPTGDGRHFGSERLHHHRSDNCRGRRGQRFCSIKLRIWFGDLAAMDQLQRRKSDRSAGSDTTYYVMTKIGNLYNQAALFGCTLESNEATCDDAPVAPYNSTNDPDNPATTDYGDNYDRNEEVTGVDQVGSGAGQAQLCDNNQGTTMRRHRSPSTSPARRPASAQARTRPASRRRRKTSLRLTLST